MDYFFVQLCIMSIQASAALMIVLVLRMIFAKAGISKKYVMFLWYLLFLLFICPFKVSLPIGFWNVAPIDYQEQSVKEVGEHLQDFNEFLEQPIKEEQQLSGLFSVQEIQNDRSDFLDGQTVLQAVKVIWAVGVFVFFGYAIVSYFIWKKKVGCCLKKADGIYCVDGLPVPITLGFFRPNIYLPSGITNEYFFYVVEHEKTHIARKDPLIKAFVYVIGCIHWCNPFVWAAYHFFEKDMEMACDEETLKRIGMEQKKQYAMALLELSSGVHRVLYTPIAFGEGDTKERIQNVMRNKKTRKTAVICLVTVGLLMLALFFTKQDYHESDMETEQENETMKTEPIGQEQLTFEQVR